VDTDTFDAIDWALLESLSYAPRAPFNMLADVLGTSDQTIARRYRRLREMAALRVSGRLDIGRLGATRWFVRLQCMPDVASGVASALASRHDTSWVHLVSGGTEVTCVVRTMTGDDATLFDRLSNSRRVTSITAHAMLHEFSPHVWPGMSGHLTEDQLAALKPQTVAVDRTSTGTGTGAPEVAEPDLAMVAMLGKDGRAPMAALAAAAGCSEAAARRRLLRLQEAGQLYFEVDVSNTALGLPLHTHLWISVLPSELAQVGSLLAAEPCVPFVGATTGPANLMASVLAASPESLYQFLTHTVAGHSGIVRFETAPIMKTFKRHGPDVALA